MTESVTVRTLCQMCDEHCGINVYLQDGRVADIDGYAKHPWNQGKVCGKARGAMDMVYHPDRLFKPLKKVNGKWVEIEMDQALAEISEKILGIKERYGARSVSYWKGEALGHAQQDGLIRRFLHALGSPNFFSNNSQCHMGRYIGYCLGFGTYGAADFENSGCIIIWGANPPASHPQMTQMIMRGRKKGAKLIVIDPRLSMIARKADLHVALKAGTDGCLALGLANILIQNEWYDRDFVAKYALGFEKFVEHVRYFTPEYVQQETGIPGNTLKQVAELMSKASPAVAIYAGNGLEHHPGGTQAARAISLLDALCGAFDRPGGILWPEKPPLHKLDLYQEIPLTNAEPIGFKEYPVLYDYFKECNTMLAMDTILTGQPYPIKAMILSGGNPVITNANSNKVRQALEHLELLVVRDLFMTPTAELAHYVLPAASYLERTEVHYFSPLQLLGISRRIFSFQDVQDEYQFLHDLAGRLGIGSYFPWPNEEELNRWLLEPSGLSPEELLSHPEGIQFKLWSYEKWQDKQFPTRSGKVEFASQYLKDLGYPELPAYASLAHLRENQQKYPFVLISGSRELLYCHSRYLNIDRLRKFIPEPELEIHPLDAARLGVEDGETVSVSSRVGNLKVKVKIMAPGAIIPGYVAMPHGWPEANVNLITLDDIRDPLDGFPLMKSVPVQIEKAN